MNNQTEQKETENTTYGKIIKGDFFLTSTRRRRHRARRERI